MEKKRILIVGPAWVGDMVMAQPLFSLIKSSQNAVIDVIAPAWSRPLLERMPEVRRSIDLPVQHGKLQLSVRWRLAKYLKTQIYDQAILCPNSFKSALVPFLAKIPLRTGWVGEWRYGLLNDIRQLDRSRYPLMIQRFMALALSKGTKLPENQSFYPRLTVDINTVRQAVETFNLYPEEKPILALCPGAEFGSAKRWPEHYYAEIAKVKLAEGWQVWLFGSLNDQVVSSKINVATGNKCIDLAGKTNLAQAIDLLSLAEIVVSNDSGLMHIAAALEKKLVAIYGSSSPNFTPPLNKKKRILQEKLDCSPCFMRECKFGHTNCLAQLAPFRVLSAIRELA